MKILFICNFDFNLRSSNINSLGGIETNNISLSKQLLNLGHQIILASKTKEEFIVEGLKNISIDNLKNNSVDYDFVVSSNFSKIFNSFRNSKHIFWLHNPFQIEKAFRRGDLFPILFNQPNVVFVSQYLKSITSILYPFKSKTIIPNGVEDIFLKIKRAQDKKPIFIITSARKKGLSEIIEMWCNKVHVINKDLELYIFGVNSDDYKEKIDSLISKGIKFFGRVERKYLADVYSYSTAMINLGYDETFCCSALEASAAGLPILTFGKTALKERVKNNINGFVLSSFDELSDCILKLNSSYHLWKRLSDKSRLNSKFFQWKNVANIWNNYLNSIE
jgi:glycosyltransferase involved in cell wall biosynthesis